MKHYILKINFLLIFFSLFLTSSFCQNPGYLGKHLTFKYNNYFSIYSAKEHKSYVDYPIPMRHHLGLALIVHPNITIDGFYTTGKTNFKSFYDIGMIESTGGEVGVTFYRNAYAPIGQYIRFSFEHSISDWSLKYNNNFFDKTTKGELSNNVFSFEAGKSGVLYDWLCYSYGAQYGFRIKNSLFKTFDKNEDYVRQRMFFYRLWSIHFGLGFLLF